jgi:hypothetical protein
MSMVKPLIEPGAQLDGFTIGGMRPPGRHGDAVDGDRIPASAVRC